MVSSEDAGFVLSYAIMMLNTDLHSPQVRHHMTTNEWIKMNKGLCGVLVCVHMCLCVVSLGCEISQPSGRARIDAQPYSPGWH